MYSITRETVQYY